jgi:hypothetical protein
VEGVIRQCALRPLATFWRKNRFSENTPRAG